MKKVERGSQWVAPIADRVRPRSPARGKWRLGRPGTRNGRVVRSSHHPFWPPLEFCFSASAIAATMVPYTFSVTIRFRRLSRSRPQRYLSSKPVNHNDRKSSVDRLFAHSRRLLLACLTLSYNEDAAADRQRRSLLSTVVTGLPLCSGQLRGKLVVIGLQFDEARRLLGQVLLDGREFAR